MRFTAEQFDQIVSALRSDAHGKKDKRQEPRVGVTGDADLVTVGPDGHRSATLARVRDVSLSGLGLICDRVLAVDQLFVLKLDGKRCHPISLVCVTAYCRRVADDQFTIGCRVKQVVRGDKQTPAAAAPAAA